MTTDEKGIEFDSVPSGEKIQRQGAGFEWDGSSPVIKDIQAKDDHCFGESKVIPVRERPSPIVYAMGGGVSQDRWDEMFGKKEW